MKTIEERLADLEKAVFGAVRPQDIAAPEGGLVDAVKSIREELGGDSNEREIREMVKKSEAKK